MEGLKDQGNVSRPPRMSAAAPEIGPKPSRSSPCCHKATNSLHFYYGAEKHVIKKQGKRDTARAPGKTVEEFVLNQ